MVSLVRSFVLLCFMVCLVMEMVMGVAVISCYIVWDTEFQAPTPNPGGSLSHRPGQRCMSDTVWDCTTKGRDISAPRLPHYASAFLEFSTL